MKPLLFVTGHVPPDRIGAFERLHELEDLELALFGGPVKHGPPGGVAARGERLPFPHVRVPQRAAGRLAASGRYRAVVCSNSGRIALPATWAGTRRARVPLILWTALWSHPRSAAHAASYLALRRLYRSADAVVTYGPHVSAYVAARGARNVHVARQSVDNCFWRAPVDSARGADCWPPGTQARFLFAGRSAPEKGIETLLASWERSGLRPPVAALALVGVEPQPSADEQDRRRGITRVEPVAAERLREIYAAASALVVPSIATATFREPWGLVVNEAMNRHLPVIASDAVGAAAGGLVRDGRNGLVAAAADSGALAAALGKIADDPGLRTRLGDAGAEDVRAYSHDAWARGFSEALATLGLARAHC